MLHMSDMFDCFSMKFMKKEKKKKKSLSFYNTSNTVIQKKIKVQKTDSLSCVTSLGDHKTTHDGEVLMK